MTERPRRVGMITAVVLAAGRSSRFGGPEPKQLLELGGRPLVQHAVDAAAAAGVDEVIVVTGHEAENVEAALRLPENGRAVRNAAFAAGMSGSLRAGLASADPASEAAVILLADQPRVGPAVIRRVLEVFRETGSPIVATRYRDVSAHPVLLARPAWALLDGVEGDVGARDVIASHPELVASVPVDGPPPRDVDTRADYEALAGPPA